MPEPPRPIRTIRVFIASSHELSEDRKGLRLRLSELNARWKTLGLNLEPVHWENFGEAMSPTRSQDDYNRVLAGCDVFVLMYHRKVGDFTREEFEQAWAGFQASGLPRMFVFRCTAPIDPGSLDLDELASAKHFEARVEALGHFKGQYADTQDLCAQFVEQLEKLRIEPGLGWSNDQRSPLSDADDSATTDLRPYLTRRAAQWRDREARHLDRRFVNLTLMVDRGLEFDGPRHEDRGRYDRLSDLLAEHAAIGAWVLVGLPGSGKSTVLQHHEMTTADAALQRLAGSAGASPPPGADTAAGVASAPAASATDPRPEICIWHRLSEYDATRSPPPAEWLASAGRWPADLPPLADLRRQARVRFLLDGLNEIQAPDRETQLAAVDRWTRWAAETAAGGQDLAPIFSVRTLDQSPMSTSGFEVRQIVLAPWEPRQIEAYCERRRGDGPSLWPTIRQAPPLLELAKLPFNLWAQCELFRTLGRPARDRAELMGGLFWQMLSKRVNDDPIRVQGIIGPRTRELIASGGWKQRLRALPDTEGCLVRWLDHALQRLHRRGRQVSVTPSELLADLPACDGAATPAQWLAAVRSLQLIDEGGSDEFSTEPLLRCTHQLWQEFFAARGIRDWAAAQPERLPDLSPPPLPGLDETLARLGVQEPLPGPDPTHWEEPVKMALQLVRDPTPWLSVLQPRNLALAGRAALASRDRLAAPTLDALRQALLARSRDAATDLRLRIEAGLILGELGDPRYEERQGPQGRYLWPRQWVTVPAGRYRIGNAGAPYDDEKPETEVELQAFRVAFAPVTNAEYRCFVEAGGYDDERWWVGEWARKWRKEGVRNEVEIEYWGSVYAEVRKDVEAWIADHPNLTESNRQWYRERAQETPEQHARMLESWYGARRYEQPQEWANPVFNAASQPVVGICQFEAQAYARWLSTQSGQPIRLPVEGEWEAAARGSSRRPWPWGQAAPGREQINADPAHLRRTSPVGVFPDSDEPRGLLDLAGNVWEWTTSRFTDRLEAQALVSEAADDLARRVVRGGSWSHTPVNCRPSCRPGSSPDNRNSNLGVRLVVSCPIQNPEP